VHRETRKICFRGETHRKSGLCGKKRRSRSGKKSAAAPRRKLQQECGKEKVRKRAAAVARKRDACGKKKPVREDGKKKRKNKSAIEHGRRKMEAGKVKTAHLK